ncbi:MAG: hypothetical protein G01um101448_986 [Parcubacteria group bacterium Gr01-1014_48]|nr:MAG: hypothetical protein G01um101448_986 [Parcubacteria group bacterium Gr01-1014_48]TSD08094.1 MAG: hypothetical protein Greene07144_413 [Parcubacteria group bacterium Greene0714_4]
MSNHYPQQNIINYVLLFFVVVLSFVLAHTAHAAAIIQRPFYIGLTNDLVGSWSFDSPDMAGDKMYDRSGSANTGTLLGTATGTGRVHGRIGQALTFDGVNDYVDIGAGPSSVNSVSFWVYTSTSTTGYFVNLTGTTDYIWSSAGTITATGFTSPTIYVNGAVSSTITAARWYHVVVTTATAENASNLDIGRTTDVNYLGGKLDDVRFYSRVLSPDEIKRLYKMGGTFTVNKPAYNESLSRDLVGSWSFDGPDMATNRTLDRSGQRNNGTIRTSTTTLVFTSAGETTFTVPGNVSSIKMKVWGGGGGGGGAATSPTGGAGGGGGFANADISVTPGETLTVRVGGGGGGGTGGGAPTAGAGGGGGGYSAVLRSSTFLIQGGGGGGGGGGGQGAGENGGAGGAGGGASGVNGTAGSGGAGVGDFGDGGTTSAGGAGGSGSSTRADGATGSANTGGGGGDGVNGSTTGTEANGGTNGGGAGGCRECADVGASGGGGGGGGRFGGGGGEAADGEGSGGGGGGSDLVTGISTTETAGSGTTPGSNTNEDYTGTAGVGGAGGTNANGTAGNPGRVVIRYEEPKLTFGRIGQGLEFSGTRNNYADIGTGPSSVNSVAFWMYLSTSTTGYFVNLTGTTDYIWSNAGTVTATGFASPTIYVNGAVSSTITAGRWYHVVVTTATAENASNLDIGRTQDINYLGGKLDDVRFYSRVLSPDEIKRLYKMGGTFTVNKSAYNGSLASGLIGSWSFDGPDTAGDKMYDRSGNDNSGTFYNTASGTGRVHGRIGQALNFDGVDNRVDMGSAASLDDIELQGGGGLSGSAWIYPRTIGETDLGKIMMKDDAADTGRWLLSFDNTGTNRIQFLKNGTTNLNVITASSFVTLNQWNHIAFTWDGSVTATNVHIFVNGSETTYFTQTNGVALASDATLGFRVGGRSNGAHTFDGFIDDIRIYNRLLSPDEIKRLYKIGK